MRFRGITDWYDALEGFSATFLEPEAARVVMRGRVEADGGLGRRVDHRIERYLTEAGRLRREYGVPTGFQQGPFFQFQTDRFALFAVDTGVRKRVDPMQAAWFRSALEAARGKFKMAILGHPLYAVGQYRAEDNDEFRAIHELLREHGVRIVMAWRHPRFRVLRRGAGRLGTHIDQHPASLRERGRRGVPHHGRATGQARGNAREGLGLLSGHRPAGGESGSQQLLLEGPALVVDQGVPGLALAPELGCRRPSTTMWPPSSRASWRCGWSRRRTASGYCPGGFMGAGCVGGTSNCRTACVRQAALRTTRSSGRSGCSGRKGDGMKRRGSRSGSEKQRSECPPLP